MCWPLSIERNYACDEVLIVLDGCKNTKMMGSFIFLPLSLRSSPCIFWKGGARCIGIVYQRLSVDITASELDISFKSSHEMHVW